MDTTPITDVLRKRKGIVIVYVVMTMLVMLSFLGLAVDGGHLFLVRTELQNAADASALAGAGALYKDANNPGAPPLLDWNRASSAAAAFVKENRSDGFVLTDGQIATGCWDQNLKTFKARLTGNSCEGSSQIPAVSVIVSRSAGNNGGPVRTFFARLIQKEGLLGELPVASNAAVAVSGFPSATPSGVTFPFMITKCVVDDYLSNPTVQKPLLITDSSVYHSSKGDIPLGQWTSFKVIADSARILEKYIAALTDPAVDNAITPPSLNLGDSIYTVPRSSAGAYLLIQHLIDAGKGVVILPVVGCDISGKTSMAVEGFAVVRLFSTSVSSVTAGFEKPEKPFPDNRPGGTGSNVVTAPLMVR